MSLFLTKDKKEIIVTCKCGCDQAFHITITDEDDDFYCLMCFLRANYDTEHNFGPWRAFKIKAKKIWSILIGKDYCYSDVLISKEEFKQFKDYVNSFED